MRKKSTVYKIRNTISERRNYDAYDCQKFLSREL